MTGVSNSVNGDYNAKGTNGEANIVVKPTKSVLAIGGTGAQGSSVVRALSADSQYTIRVLTRHADSPSALELASLPNVSLFVGDSYDDTTLGEAFKNIDFAYVNTNGFAIGEKAEIYWGIRMYELARGAGVKHFLWAGLLYSSKRTGYDPKFRSGHLDGKGKVSEFIKGQPTTPMAWTILTSCLYMEMLYEMLLPRPSPAEPNTLVFSFPAGQGAVPLICLEDLGQYARWIFNTPSRSNGIDLEVATQNIKGADLASVFTEVTGRKAVYQDVTLDDYFASGGWPNADEKVGHSADHADKTLQTYRQNFSGFWNFWKVGGGRDGKPTLDYELLDNILPGRIKIVKEWMEKTGYTGDPAQVPILKDYSDAKTKSS